MNRREFLATGGALVVSFSLNAQPKLPGSLAKEPLLDSWIRIGADGGITVFTGKVELGQGIKTALIQVAAEELAVEPGRIELVTADTARTPDEQYTAGSQSMSESGVAILAAAAEVRSRLLAQAARRFDLPPERLAVANGAVRAADGRSASYGELVKDEALHVKAEPQPPRRAPGERAVIGRSLPRVDIPAKVTGAPIYVHDLRLPGMVHARVVRPPSYAARLASADGAAVEKLPGVLKIVRDGSFLAVVAEREYQAVSAMRALAAAARWTEPPALFQHENVYAELQRLPARDSVLVESRSRPGAWTHEATFRRPYQMHGSIGPSCAVGLYRDGAFTVWTHSQGVYPLRGAIAEMLGLAKERVRCIHMEGSGCYGHNGADDAGADAALVARALPGRPVRVLWMREQEHAWEPYGSAMVTAAKARLEGGRIADWHYEVWSNTHTSRPGPAGNLSSAWLLEKPFAAPPPVAIPPPTGGGDRNAIPLYRFPGTRVVHHFVTAMPLRVSALRSLGAYMNVFSIESFMDELARAARADPVEFRLAHLDDPRAREVVRTAAARFDWAGWRPSRGRGRGFAFARYKNLAAYAAIACEVEADRTSGEVRMLRAAAAIDSGEAVNPDGIRSQVEGGILQSLSWTLYEAVRFDRTRITSLDWASYPILRFPAVPERIDVEVITRPGAPFLGTGEAAQGPAAAALANAIADATGARLREIPFTAERVREALA